MSTSTTIKTSNPLTHDNTQKKFPSSKTPTVNIRENENFKKWGGAIPKEHLVSNANEVAIKATKQAKNNNDTIPTSNNQTTNVKGVPVEGYETLTSKQKQNLQEQLLTYQEKIKASIKDGSFDKFIEMAFGKKVDNPAELAALKKAVKEGKWNKVIPTIKMGDQSSFDTARTGTGKKVDAMGAFIKGSEKNGGTGTIILNKSLLDGPITKNGQTISFQDILTEEIGHSWDVKLNNTDSKGDEGEALSILLNMSDANRTNFLSSMETIKSQGGDVDHLLSADKLINAALRKTLEAVKIAQAENDNGTMTITNADGTTSEIEVEFGWFKKVFKSVKKGFRKVVKAATKFYTMPLKIASEIIPGPVGEAFGSAVDFIDDATDKALDAVEDLADKYYETLDNAWKKFEKNVLQSKWLGPVLTVMSFIPVLGTVAMVARLALATYQVGKGLETGNWKMALSGAVSAVGGASAGGLISGATATAAASTLQTGYAVYNGVEATRSGNYGAALGAFASAAGQTGAIDTSTVNNLTTLGNTYTALDKNDTRALYNIASTYAGDNTSWGKQNKDTLKTTNVIVNTVDVLSNSSKTNSQKAEALNGAFAQTGVYSQETQGYIDTGIKIADSDTSNEDKAIALANLGTEADLVDQKTTNTITSGANISKAINNDKLTDAEKLAETSRQLYNADLITEENQNTIIDGTDFYTRTKAGDARGGGDIAERYNVISSETNNSLHYYADIYDLSQEDPDTIIKELTSDDSTLLDSDTKKTVKDSYALYKDGKESYNIIKNGSTSDQIKLANNSGLVNDELSGYLKTTTDYYDLYKKDDWAGILAETNILSKKDGNGEFHYS